MGTIKTRSHDAKEWFKMKLVEFEMLKRKFKEADVEEKINLYIESEGLTQEQYKELLKMFPLSQLNELEAAMA